MIRLGIHVLDLANRLVQFFTNPVHRSIVVSRLVSPDQLHQTTILTWMDRYPRIFSACRDYFGETRKLNILSFGCSTGEEVVTLRRYFPEARIVGADINKRNLSLCRQRGLDDKISFIYSTRESIQAQGPFDAILCMAVLQRTPHKIKNEGVVSLESIYPFEKFDRQVEELDGYLRTKGLMVIHHSQYQFPDSSVAERYTPLETGPLDGDDALKFGRDSRRIDPPSEVRSIFIKQADARP